MIDWVMLGLIAVSIGLLWCYERQAERAARGDEEKDDLF